MGIRDRLQHAWNAFANQPSDPYQGYGDYVTAGSRQDRPRMFISNEMSIVSSIYTRLGIDCAAVDIRHSRVDDEERYLEEIDSGLNNCLKLRANTDQAARAFRQDIYMTLFDKGVAAIVPVDTTISPNLSGGFDIQTMRVGEVLAWHPQHVRVNLYNEKTGKREQITVPKSACAVVENPLYSIMNEPNSTLQRLIRKLNLLDGVDEASSSGKLDLIIQLPYTIKSETRRSQAEQRRKDMEFQLKGSKYGIAYADATEKVTQLNRPAENNLMSQIEWLTNLLWSQLGLTAEVMNGTADEKTMLNYHNRTIEPCVTSVVESMEWSFLTKTARTQKQKIKYFTNRLKLIPIGGEGGVADIADKLTRNEVASSNEMRQVIGWKPRTEPQADELRNSNMPRADTDLEGNTPPEEVDRTEAVKQKGQLAVQKLQAQSA